MLFNRYKWFLNYYPHVKKENSFHKRFSEFLKFELAVAREQLKYPWSYSTVHYYYQHLRSFIRFRLFRFLMKHGLITKRLPKEITAEDLNS